MPTNQYNRPTHSIKPAIPPLLQPQPLNRREVDGDRLLLDRQPLQPIGVGGTSRKTGADDVPQNGSILQPNNLLRDYALNRPPIEKSQVVEKH